MNFFSTREYPELKQAVESGDGQKVARTSTRLKRGDLIEFNAEKGEFRFLRNGKFLSVVGTSGKSLIFVGQMLPRPISPIAERIGVEAAIESEAEFLATVAGFAACPVQSNSPDSFCFRLTSFDEAFRLEAEESKRRTRELVAQYAQEPSTEVQTTTPRT